MELKLAQALVWLRKIEGGYVDHPDDPGGATNFGVTQFTYDQYRIAHSLPTRSVRDIEPHETEDIYESMYWKPCGAPLIADTHPALCFALFDAAVHQGVKSAIKLLQKCVGVTEDGVFGPNTLVAVRAKDDVSICQKFVSERTAVLMSLSRPGRRLFVFRKGWLNRMRFVSAVASTLIPKENKIV